MSRAFLADARRPGTPSPLAVVRVLERSSPGRSCVVYDDGETARIAYGASRDLTVEGGFVVERDGEGREIHRERAVDPLAQVGARLRASAPDRAAYGYVAFDVTGFYRPYKKAMRHPILRFVVPEVECRVDREGIAVRGPAAEAIANEAVREPEVAPPSGPSQFPLPSGEDRAAYERAILTIREAIARGEVEKVIIARRHAFPGALDLHATYALALQNRAARRFLLRLGGVSGVGSCPEIVLRVTDDRLALTTPLAGTRPRGKTPEEDARMRRELYADPKEVREHAMSARLAQQEIAEVAERGESFIQDFMRIQEYPFTLHLASTVRGVLAPERTGWDALRAVFPGVTCTGIDKSSAIGWIDRLEAEPRGVYGGVVGFVEPTGAMDFGITLRSVFQYDGEITLNAGAGIVAESDAAYEYEESVNKMRTMMSKVVLA